MRRLALLLLAALLGCGPDSPLRDAVREESAHERYARALRDAGLDQAALGRDWLRAAEGALSAAAPVTLPFREAGYFAESEARAVAYRVRVRRGQRIVAAVETQGATPARLFIDLFEPPAPGDSLARPRRVASADSGALRVTAEAERDGDYLVRLQPELLRGVRWTLTLAAEASLAFPVAGKDSRAVQSVFGVARDGGQRSHQGIDIFARRGTPVLAAGAGIAYASDNRLGGKVVWVRDPLRGRSLYYAHLDSQTVGAAERVEAGDTLGFVGNTGNARTTPPHLHFGIYRRGEGALDPYPFVHQPRGSVAVLAADTAAFGAWRRVAGRRGAVLRVGPDDRAAVLDTLPARTALRVEGASGRYYRVRLPDGSGGYLAAAGTASAETPVARTTAARPEAVRDRPTRVAAAVDSVRSGSAVPVLGRFGEFLLVRTAHGRTGWMAAN